MYKSFQDAFGNWFVSCKTEDGQELVMCQVVEKQVADYLVQQLNKADGNPYGND